MKRTTLGISILAIAVVVILMIINPYRTDKGETDHPSVVNNLSSPRRIETSRMLRVNSIEANNQIVNQLNNDQSVRIINHNGKDKSHYVEHEVVVRFLKNPNDQQILVMNKEIDGELKKNGGEIYLFKSKSNNTTDLLDYFRKDQNVIYVEPHFILLQNDIDLPDDILYREQYQWNLPIIEAEKGWNITRGNKKVIIAIVDTGVDLDHPDLKGRLVKGYNALKDNRHPDDDNGHGTHVAGIIASETNNHEGAAGITWYNKIMPVKVMGKEGYGTTYDIAKGIIWAADHGAGVINLSLGNYQPSKLLKDAVQYAYSKGVVMVSAAGNDNTDQPSFPSAFPEVLSVSAVGYDGEKADFSNYGNYIDVAAPGVSIPSTYFKKQYAALSGTSMASPHVAGLAGLILSINPRLSNLEVMDIIRSSSYDLGEKGKDHYFGNGLIDINNALNIAQNGA